MLRTSQVENIGRGKLVLVGLFSESSQAHGLNIVSEVSLLYERFKPTGKAYVTLTTQDSLKLNLRLLQKASLASIPVNVWTEIDHGLLAVQSRNRGTKGRRDAADRGLITGDGPDGGIVSNGRVVVVSGLPGKLGSEGFRRYLKRFGVSGGQQEITKIERYVLHVLELNDNAYFC
jgi:hypothetical protein